ncbi:MAG: TonB-dependent receptor [Prolixibacteraceae bacterium]|nr:TonB-dependent receptor [Prolixibacteraceae bacterium]
MKKRWFLTNHRHLFACGGKFLKIMKITIFIVVFASMQTFALDNYAQTKRMDVKIEDSGIVAALEKIEAQSEFFFFYNNKVVKLDKIVSVDLKNKTINEILDAVFKDTDIEYTINNRQIILSGKDTGISQSQQQKSVSGKVTDSSGGVLPGVTVVVKGTTTGVITNTNGNFSLSNIPENAILQFSFVGMKTQEVFVASKTIINVTLAEETVGIEEVVAIGYGTMKKSDLTGSIASVKSDEISAFSTSNVIQALAGRAAGVQITQNTGSLGGNMQVRIRGNNSIKGNNEPLYIIDGFPGDISILNNADIERIEILKDASATAIYGSRGANGVVLITTKHGKAGKTKIDFESSFGVSQISKKFDLMNGKEFALLYNELANNRGKNPYFTQSEIDSFGDGTDWQDVCFRIAPIQNHVLSISGGTEKTQFIVSGTIFDQKGILEGTDYQKYSLKANINHDISKKFSINYGAILTRTNKNGNESGGSSNSLISSILTSPPTLTPYYEDGTIRRLNNVYSFVYANMINPLYLIKETSNSAKTNIILANVAFFYKPIPDLIIKVAGNVNNSDYRGDNYITNQFVGIGTPGAASVSTSQNLSLLGENTITYTKSFNENHKFNALAGFTYENNKYTMLAASGSGFMSDVFETYNLGAAKSFGIPSTAFTESTLLSYLGRANYSYKDRYLLTVSMRADGSSKFSEGNKWGYFPSGAFAWRIKEESFLKDNPNISDLKFRIGWGKTGSQAISAYATQVLLSSGSTVFDDTGYTYFAPSSIYPGDLKWETTEQTNVGVDVGFLNNRLHLTADYYYKRTSDLLNSVILPASEGWSSIIKNIGSIQNKGLELTIDANILDGRFKWDVSGNIAFNRNKVLKLSGGQDITGSLLYSEVINDFVSLLREGHPFAEFYGYIEDGYDNKGTIKYKDLNSDGLINNLDKTFIGDPNPDFIYGFNSTMSYRNFELNMFFNGSYGNDIFNYSSSVSTLNILTGANLLRNVYLDHWTPEKTDAKYPAINFISGRVSDRFVEDGSYLRLRNIQLGYTFPVKKYGLNWLSNLQLYISGQNLITFTSYSGWDPDVSSLGGGNSINQGIDFFTYPSSKSITCGIKVIF